MESAESAGGDGENLGKRVQPGRPGIRREPGWELHVLSQVDGG